MLRRENGQIIRLRDKWRGFAKFVVKNCRAFLLCHCLQRQKNKEFSNALCGKAVILLDLLLGLGIVLKQECYCGACKKCARKIVNCYKLFMELHKSLDKCPTGLTPASKRQRCQSANTTVPQAGKAKRSLSENVGELDRYSALNDEILHRMNIPIPDTSTAGDDAYLPPIVKVNAN